MIRNVVSHFPDFYLVSGSRGNVFIFIFYLSGRSVAITHSGPKNVKLFHDASQDHWGGCAGFEPGISAWISPVCLHATNILLTICCTVQCPMYKLIVKQTKCSHIFCRNNFSLKYLAIH